MTADAIRQVRRFSRTVTEGLQVLDDNFLGRARPLGESRLLWEIGTNDVELRSLRQRLALDSGYVTRVLQSLERQRLVRVSSSRTDRRVRIASLTARGRREWRILDRRSDARARAILEPVPPSQRGALVSAMAEVERLLQASMVRFEIEDPNGADARWCLRQYFSELGLRFEAGFDPARGLPADAAELTPPQGAFVVARLRGRAVGCGGFQRHGRASVSIRRMWIAPEVRGLGLGARMLAELERHARARGARIVRLETNRALKEAIALYRQSGYREVRAFNDEPYAHHWFEKRLPRRRDDCGL